jgi:hypothetical protein
VALAAGGFDESFGGNVAGRPPAGWDSDLAWRIRRGGYGARFQHGALVYNEVFPMGMREWLADAVRAVNLPRSVRYVPELRGAMLHRELFIDRSSMRYDLALAGLIVALWRRHPLPLIAGVPWILWVVALLRGELRSPLRWPEVGLKATFIGVKQGVTLGALLLGSARARRVVL